MIIYIYFNGGAAASTVEWLCGARIVRDSVTWHTGSSIGANITTGCSAAAVNSLSPASINPHYARKYAPSTCKVDACDVSLSWS